MRLVTPERQAAHRALKSLLATPEGCRLLEANCCPSDVPVLPANESEAIWPVMSRVRLANAPVVLVGVHSPISDQELRLLRFTLGPKEEVDFEIGATLSIGAVTDVVHGQRLTVRVTPTITLDALQ